jgi:DNA-binding transcriptional regulator YiaG
MTGTEEVAHHAELRITEEEARQIASLLRYAVSLNTTVGLVSPTERRVATPTYRAMELAAQTLEGKTFEEATQAATAAWTGSLKDEYQRALELVQSSQEAIRQVMAQYMQPDQFAQYLEVSQEQFLELMKSGMSMSPGVDVSGK